MPTALTDIQSRLIQAYSPRIERLFTRRVKREKMQGFDSFLQYLQSIPNCVTTGMLDLTGGQGGDKAARWLLQLSTGNTPEAFESGDARPAGGVGVDTTAELDWKGLWVTKHINGRALRAGTPNATIDNEDIWIAKMEEVIDDLVDDLDSYLSSAKSAAKAPVGIADVLGSDSNTYAGVDRSTTSQWRPAITDLSGAQVGRSHLKAMHKIMTETRKCGYDRILCGTTQFDMLAEIIDGRRFNSNDMGVNTLLYKQKPVNEIPGLPEDAIYFVKDKHWGLPMNLFRGGVLNGQLQQPTNERGLPFGLFAGDDGSDGQMLTMAHECNLVYRNTREAGVLDNCATS